MDCVLQILFLYMVSILVYITLVFVFIKPYYRNRILLADKASINEDRSITNRDATMLDTFMYENYYCYGFIYPLFIVVKIVKAAWFLIVGSDDLNGKINTIKDNDFKPHHW